MKGASKISGKAKTHTLYDEDGKVFKIYGVVEEENNAGENYEDVLEQQDTSRDYEYPKDDHEYYSWADVTEWHEKQKGNADYNGDYQEEKGGNRWTGSTGKGRGQSSRGQSRPPAARVASPPKEKDVRYYQQAPSSSRGVAQYAAPSGKGAKGSEWYFPEPERPAARGGTAQTRAASRGIPERKMPSRATSRPPSSWKDSEDVEMKDKPKEVIDLEVEDTGTRSRSVARSPWPEGHKKIGPPGAPPKDEVSEVVVRVLKLAQEKIDQVQLEQMNDEDAGCYSYEVAYDRSRAIQKIIGEAVTTCGGFLTPPVEVAEINLTARAKDESLVQERFRRS